MVISGGPLLGEIRTGLIRNSGPASPEIVKSLLSLMPQRMVKHWERPIRHDVSPEVLTGVDCLMPHHRDQGKPRRGVGTVVTDLRVTAGSLLQATTRVRLVPAKENRRLSWSHYLARPGVVETWGEVVPGEVVDAFFSADEQGGAVLDLGSQTEYQMSNLQASPQLNGSFARRYERTRLRWAAVVTTEPAAITFIKHSDTERTLRLNVPPELSSQVPELCQDIALHDWLLSSVIALADGAPFGVDRQEVVRQVTPAVDDLFHAWLPQARLGDEMRRYWQEIDRRSHLTPQWKALVEGVRDQVALATVELAVAAQTGDLALPEPVRRRRPIRASRVSA